MCKRAFAVAGMTVKKAVKHPRSILLLIILFIYMDYTLHGVKTFCEAYSVQVSLVELIAQTFGNATTQCVFVLLYAFLIMDMPGMDRSEQYVIMRSGTGAWMLGKCIALVCFSIMWFVSIALMMLVVVRHVSISMQWSNAMITLAKTDATRAFSIRMMFERKIITNYSLPSATWISITLNLILAVVGGMWVLLINFMLRRPVGNFLMATAAYISESIGGILTTGAIYKFSPVSLTLLSVINGGIEDAYPTLQYSLVFGGIAALMVIGLMMITVEKRKDYSDYKD